MYLFAQTRTRRRSAVVMLGAWVFALLVGIANSCALGKPDASHAGSERQTTLAGHEHDTHASTGTEATGDADGSHSLRPACQKFCDDEAATVVKPYKAFDVVAIATCAAAVVWWSRASAAPPLQARPDACPPEAPLISRFMRLTI